ncbi:MAG: ABC transporter permease [Victivallales bacterium]
MSIFLRTIPAAILLLHIGFYIFFSAKGRIPPFELFNLMLLAANILIFLMFFFRKISDATVGLSIMFLIGSHAFIGQFLAPDSLTSGAILLINILTVYTGIQIARYLSSWYWYVFVMSYFMLFWLFILRQENAEALFLASLMGLCAVARSYRLMTYFWGFVIAFTFCQPFAWEAAVTIIIVLNIIFNVRGSFNSMPAKLALFVGLVFIFLVLLPVVSVLIGEDPRSIINVIKDPRVLSALKTTLITATVSSIILLAFLTPFAYAAARLHFPGRNLLYALIDVPIIIPQSVAGIALIKIFGREQVVGQLLYDTCGIYFDDTLFGICLAQIFVSLPFFLKPAIQAFENVPANLEHAACSLGSSPLGTYFRVALPLAAKGILIGTVIAWGRAAGEFGAVLLLAPSPETVPVLAFNRFQSAGMVETGPLVAAFLMFSLVMFFLLQFVTNTMKSHNSTTQ